MTLSFDICASREDEGLRQPRRMLVIKLGGQKAVEKVDRHPASWHRQAENERCRQAISLCLGAFRQPRDDADDTASLPIVRSLLLPAWQHFEIRAQLTDAAERVRLHTISRHSRDRRCLSAVSAGGHRVC